MEHRRARLFLIEITAEVLDQVDAATGRPLVELIVDAAEQKGTGRWTVQTALELGVPVSTIAESVFARSASGDRAVREAARGVLRGPDRELPAVERRQLVDDVRDALWSSRSSPTPRGWSRSARRATSTTGASTSRRSRGCGAAAASSGPACSSRSATSTPSVGSPRSSSRRASGRGLAERQGAWRRVVAAATTAGVPVPGFSRRARLLRHRPSRASARRARPGLRDNFGAHTYGRVDRAGAFHTLWSSDRTEVQL